MNNQQVVTRQPAGRNKKNRKTAKKGGALPKPRSTPIVIPNQVPSLPSQMMAKITSLFTSVLPMTTSRAALAAIERTNCLLIVQCLQPLDMFIGLETANKYVVHDMFMQPVLYCHEKSGFISRACCRSKRSFVMEMKDAHGIPFMSAHRKAPFIDTCCYSSEDVLDTYLRGTKIGMMNLKCCQDDFMVYAAGCNQALHITSPSDCDVRCGGTLRFDVLGESGGRIGEIVRLDQGYLHEFLTDADSFLVHFPPSLPSILKLLLLSAVFLVDFTYFEEGGGILELVS